MIAPGEFAHATQGGLPEYWERLRKFNDSLDAYDDSIREIAKKRGAILTDFRGLIITDTLYTRDGLHLTELLHTVAAEHVFQAVLPIEFHRTASDDIDMFQKKEPEESLHQFIIAKNRLWFDYWRVQNWAFLAGDRTEQPSSRDHVDRTKRWFPAEREQFLPLIEAKEQEIWSLAAKLAQP